MAKVKTEWPDHVEPQPAASVIEAPKRGFLRSSRKTATLLSVIAVVGMGIRTYRLTDRNVRFDEASSWWTSQFPLPEMLNSLARNVHLPPYFFLLKCWIAIFGDSLWSMRGLSVILGGVTIVGTYLFAAEAFRKPASHTDLSVSQEKGRWIGLCSAALVAVSMMQIRAALEVRMYTMGTALIALSSWTLFRALHSQPDSARCWIVHGLVTLLFAYTHHYALFSIAAQIVFLFGYFLLQDGWNPKAWISDPILRRATFTYCLVTLGWMPWLPILLRQAAQVQTHFWTSALTAETVLDRVYEMFFYGPRTRIYSALTTGGCACVLLMLSWKAAVGEMYIVSLAATPLSMAIVVSSISRNIFAIQYLVFAHLFLLIALAALLGRINDRWERNLIAAFIVIAGVTVYIDFWVELGIPHKQPGLRAAIAHIETHRRSDEQIIVSYPTVYFPALYYLKDRKACHVFNDGKPFLHHDGGPLTVDDDLIKEKEFYRIAAGRIWVLSRSDRNERLPLPRHWKLVESREFRCFQANILVSKYEILNPVK